MSNANTGKRMGTKNNIFEERKAFNFYRSYYQTSLLLDKENKAEFLEAILNYQFTGEINEPKLPMAKLAFNGQLHSLKKQVTGYSKGKETYPYGNPTKGQHKGSHKQVQEQEKEQVQEQEELVVSKRASATPKKKSLIEKRLEREKKFYDELTQFISQYPKETIRAFFDYWAEPNKSGSKMRWEMERTWDLPRRVAKWSQNEDKWANTGRLTETPTLDPKKRNYV